MTLATKGLWVGGLVIVATVALVGCQGEIVPLSSTGKNSLAIEVANGNAKGRLTSVGNAAVRTYYQYDALGRATATQHAAEGKSYVYTATYGFAKGGEHPAGNVVVKESIPDGTRSGETVTYGYDRAGKRSSVKAKRGGSAVVDTIVTSIQYNVRGQETAIAYGNNSTITKEYSSTDLRLRRISANAPEAAIDLKYDYDDVGNVK